MKQAPPTFQPLYVQIKALLERALAAGVEVSQGTVRKAIGVLAAENLLVRRQGKGTFVATHTEEKSGFRFLRIRRNDGKAEYPASHLIDLRRGKASADSARLLRVKSGDPVFVLRRVLDFGGAPAILDEITLPASLFKGLTRARYTAYTGSTYGFFETEFGVRMLRAEERLHAVAADATTSELLRVAPGTPLLAVDRVAFTYGDRPVELRRGLCTTRDEHYWNTLA